MKNNYFSLSFASWKNFIKNSFFSITTVALAFSGFFIPNIVSATNPVLGVTKITAVQTYAIADNTFEHGWRWVLAVTVPEKEKTLKMKFDNWFNGTDTILAQNNIRFFSDQSSNANSTENAIVIADSNTYSSAMNINTDDLDPVLAGRQIEITVEVKVPVGKTGGSYSTSYGIHTWADQNIAFPTIGDRTFGDAPFDLVASASSDLPITFAVVSGPATLSGKVLTVTGVGAVEVKASQVGNDNFNPADDVSQTFNVVKANPTVTWSNPESITYPAPLTGTQLNATAKGVDGNSLDGTFVYTPAVDAVLNAGTAQTLSVTFTPTDTVNYNSVTQTVKIDVLKADQTINWENPADITYGTLLSSTQLNATVSVTGTTPAGGLTYSPIVGTKLGAGTDQTLNVSVAGTSDYNPASKTVKINVLKANQTITFVGPGNQKLEDGSVVLTASSDSTLPISFTLVSGPATLSGSTLTFTAAGSVTVKASQAGDSNFNPATDVSVTFEIKDSIVPVVGVLNWSTVKHPTNDSVSPVGNKYTIGTPLMGSDIFTSLSVVVTDLDLNKTDVPVFVDGSLESNGNMVYDGKVWNYVPGTPVSFTDGTHSLVATFKDNSNNSLKLTAEFVVDREAPVIAVHNDITQYVSTKTSAVVNYALPEVIDNHSIGLVASCDPVSGSTFVYGDTTVNCNAVDNAGNKAVQTSFVVHVVDNVAPEVTVTGFTFDDSDMPGTLTDGFTLNTDNTSGTHKVQFKSGSVSNEDLANEVFGLFLKPTPGQTDELVAYYLSKPEAYRTYLNSAAAGVAPFAYIKGSGDDTSLKLLDGAQYTLGGVQVDMYIPDNYPLGTYTVEGKVKDLVGNEKTVTYKLIIAAAKDPITATIAYDPASWTNGSVVATITPSESVLPETVLTHTFTDNGSYTFNFTSLRRTSGSVVAAVSKIDKVAPTGTLSINGGAEYTNTRDVTLTLSATDDLSGVTQVEVYKNTTPQGIENYATTRLLTVTTGDGTKIVKVKFFDAAGNGSNLITKTIILDTTKPVINLKGNSPVTVYQNVPYTDAGATVTDNLDSTVSVVTTNTVDTTTVGTYTVKYNSIDKAGNSAVEVTRTVNVIANPYTLSVSGTKGMLAYLEGVTHTPYGDVLTASTNPSYFSDKNYEPITVTLSRVDGSTAYDGNVTLPVPTVGVAGSQAWAYSAEDNVWFDFNTSGFGGPDGKVASTLPNPMSVTVYVVSPTVQEISIPIELKAVTGISAGQVLVSATINASVKDITKPVITILGAGNNGNPAYVIVGGTYTDAGASAMDNVDGDVTSKIIPTSNIDVNKVGHYTVTYEVTDAGGNKVTAIRNVEVVEPEYNIAMEYSTGGSISAIAKSLQDATYKITPNAGYHTVDVLVDGVSVGVVTSYTFSNVHGNHTISAVFAVNPDFNVVAADFGVMDFSGVRGYNVGFNLVNATAADVQKIVVKLYKGDTVIATDESLNITTQYPTATSLSAPFDVFGSFNYVADGSWTNSGKFSPTEIPTSAEITVTFKYGVVKTVVNNNAPTGDLSLFNAN